MGGLIGFIGFNTLSCHVVYRDYGASRVYEVCRVHGAYKVDFYYFDYYRFYTCCTGFMARVKGLGQFRILLLPPYQPYSKLLTLDGI